MNNYLQWIKYKKQQKNSLTNILSEMVSYIDNDVILKVFVVHFETEKKTRPNGKQIYSIISKSDWNCMRKCGWIQENEVHILTMSCCNYQYVIKYVII